MLSLHASQAPGGPCIQHAQHAHVPLLTHPRFPELPHTSQAVTFLKRIKEVIEDPRRLLIDC